MNSPRKQLDEAIESLKRQRDELRVQMELGKSEVRDEWVRVTQRLEELLAQYEPLRDALSETSENVVSAMKLVTEEIQAGFERIRKSL